MTIARVQTMNKTEHLTHDRKDITKKSRMENIIGRFDWVVTATSQPRNQFAVGECAWSLDLKV
eukprot:m.60664 g.60664  ORF g.60664 m.60664 type:complete len:63 (+) comp22867_c0_seq2:188-376(+)